VAVTLAIAWPHAVSAGNGTMTDRTTPVAAVLFVTK